MNLSLSGLIQREILQNVVIKQNCCVSYPSRQELSSGVLVTKIGVDTVENEPVEKWLIRPGGH